jgi:hypothetical protein
MTLRRLFIILGLAAAVMSKHDQGAWGQAPDPERLSRIKAGLVLNFVRYSEWPAEAFASDESPIAVVVLGKSGIEADLEKVLAGQKVRGRALQVRHVDYPQPQEGEATVSEDRLREFFSDLRAAHAIFVGDSERDRLDAILKNMEGTDVLTISDIAGFAERGGMLGLVIRQERMAFDANREEIQRTRIKVSSHLLQLARIVKTREK